MKKLKIVLLILAVLILIAGGTGISYYVYESTNFFSTENAQITSDIITLTPEVTGKVKSWDVKEGDYVKAGQVIGKQDVGMLVTSSAMNPQTLSSTADSIISKADIKAPIDGKIVQSNVVKGEVISPGMEIATVADTSHIYIKANIEETDIIKIKPGQKVDIKIDAYPRKSFEGYVESIGQATQSAFSQFPSLNTSGTFSKVTQLIPVKIAITNINDLTLMLGMNATVKIHVRQ
ncbi:MAG: putative multidrug resistance protein EmrK [Pelotomaculum sp. PtaB.Bin013]|uniref:HlyD family efflux transporter periplasmic adaptor subunit n=1 Tax=Pelotomaculum isophthalicicum JI TaxID=947010 RepID=A0A9X4JWR5_9FIRM|nr:HlyD family efflux transporter periplasmic adaptor subunit [Pelotomaculum isophthalicicum]MDF9409748.1 HlyD family efflux transporter periplasmic adaptor subunit [Pelotomaculum isophthalicicum JI]OPX90585.1 MAG: putative multidrug resistance protein EmrK [Pelotomaculum sp. PtaB.Bin013]